MKNPFNNLLSFLITIILIIMLAVLMLNSIINTHKRAEEQLKYIEQLMEEKRQEIDEILKEVEDE
jgi:hypothetical protein